MSSPAKKRDLFFDASSPISINAEPHAKDIQENAVTGMLPVVIRLATEIFALELTSNSQIPNLPPIRRGALLSEESSDMVQNTLSRHQVLS